MADKLISVLENGTFKRFVDMGDGTYAERVAAAEHPSRIIIPTRSAFTRPADTTAYAPYDLVANSTTAGSVTPLSWSGVTMTGSGGRGRIKRVWMGKGGTATARFRLHFFESSPTVDNGDNGILVFNAPTSDGYIGATDEFEIVGGALKLGGIGGATGGINCDMGYVLGSGDAIYGLLETTSAWTPVSGASFAVLVEFWREA